MIIKVTKDKDDIITNLIIKEEEVQFDYVRLINELYNNNTIEDIEFSEDIEEWEREEIWKLIKDINKTIINQDRENEHEDSYEDLDDIPF